MSWSDNGVAIGVISGFCRCAVSKGLELANDVGIVLAGDAAAIPGSHCCHRARDTRCTPSIWPDRPPCVPAARHVAAQADGGEQRQERRRASRTWTALRRHEFRIHSRPDRLLSRAGRARNCTLRSPGRIRTAGHIRTVPAHVRVSKRPVPDQRQAARAVPCRHRRRGRGRRPLERRQVERDQRARRNARGSPHQQDDPARRG